MEKLKMGDSASKYSLQRMLAFCIIIIIILLGLMLRSRMYSNYLTYVDSYKYLLDADSFNHSIPNGYTKTDSSSVGKFGFSVALAGVNSPFKSTGDALITKARLLNVVLSILIGLMVLLFLKRAKAISIFFFISPLFVSYSSYVISEYLSLLFAILGVFLAVRIVSKTDVGEKIRSGTVGLSLFTGLFLGMLPIVRLELLVISALIVFYLIYKYKNLAQK